MIKKEIFFFEPTACDTEDSAWLQLLDFLQTLKDRQLQCLKLHFSLTDFYKGLSLAELQSLFFKRLSALFGEKTPALSLVLQSPWETSWFHIEIFTCSSSAHSDLKIQHLTFDSSSHWLLQSAFAEELWTSTFYAPYVQDGVKDVRLAYTTVFEKVTALLQFCKMNFDQILRQWNYIGHLLHLETQGQETSQNYQIFNEVRSKFYTRYKRENGYPVATGIGMDCDWVGIDLVAYRCNPPLQNKILRSPIQKNAFDYTQDVLVGNGLKKEKQPPFFERGRLIQGPEFAQLWISGTASIEGEKTIAPYCTNQQTENTCRYIHQLLNQTDQNSHLQRGRVYIRRDAARSLDQEILHRELGDRKLFHIVEADICREDLTVEIEAEYEI